MQASRRMSIGNARAALDEQGSAVPLIALAVNDWDGPWRNRQHMLTRLAHRGWPIIYSTGPLCWWERGSHSWANAPSFGRFETKNGVCVHVAGRIPFRWPTYEVWDQWIVRKHARLLRRHSPGLKAPVVCLYHPSLWPIAQHLQPCPLVYYAYDNFRRESGWDDRLAAAERAAVDCAAMVVATTAAIGDSLPAAAARKLRILGNGVDFASVVAATSDPCPRELAAIPRPRIGYCGVVNRKLDYALVAQIALQRPDWHWVFIGPEAGFVSVGDTEAAAAREAWRHCQRLPNVHYLGALPPERFIPCLHHMDVNVICNRTDSGWWQDAYPLKFHEYLAAGRPVVSSPVSSLLEFTAVADFAAGVEPWLAAIERAIDQGGIGTPASRRAVARQNDWAERVDHFERWLKEIALDGASVRSATG